MLALPVLAQLFTLKVAVPILLLLDFTAFVAFGARALRKVQYREIGPLVPFILAGVRTPFVKSDGAFRDAPVYELGRVAVGELLARWEVDPGKLDEVVLGNCAQPSEAANVSRITALRAGVPAPVPAVTVHRNCASGMEAVAAAANRIATEVECGVVSINHFHAASHDTPFGGVKDSGYGREGGAECFEGYLGTKLVSFKTR